MDLTWAVRTRAVLERATAWIGGAAVLVAALAVPYLAARTTEEGRDAVPEVALARQPIRMEVVESWATKGFAELAKAVATMPAEPTWESVRKLMEERGLTRFRYVVQFRWTLADGSSEVVPCIRRPYQRRELFEEFLRILRDGLVEMDRDPPQVHWSISDGPPSAAGPDPCIRP